MKKFELDPHIDSASIYADQIMRPMAQVYCPLVLAAFDNEYNSGEGALGPNWHTFAADLERASVKAHKFGHQNDLVAYFTFLNWAMNEPTSYLQNETVLTPMAGFTYEITPEAWMKYFPIPNLEEVIHYAKGYFKPEVVTPLIAELDNLRSDPQIHDANWQPLHESFSRTASRLNVPFANLL